MTAPDAVTVILVIQALGNLIIAALYSLLRLRKEERKVKATEASAASNKAAFDSMTVYHAKRLEIEERKLEATLASLKYQADHGRGGTLSEEEEARGGSAP